MDETRSFLMEKIRARGGGFKAMKDYSKLIKTTLLEKRYAPDINEKGLYQENLDLLLQNTKVTTMSAMVERLGVISRHLGLKFHSATSSRLGWFISSDVFYVEVLLETCGSVKDVIIDHAGINQSCVHLKNSLENRDFKDFSLQLEGLISIYDLNADREVKSNAFKSLQHLEADILNLFESQCSYISDPFSIIHKSDVGFVKKRRGGHPMKIIYFVSPYDLIDLAKNTCKSLTLDVPDVNCSVSLCLESSSNTQLQTQSLVKIIKSERIEDRIDIFNRNVFISEHNAANTTLLPACFNLKFNEAMPICNIIIEMIEVETGIQIKRKETSYSIIQLMQNMDNYSHQNDSTIVTLPDQRHNYIMSDNNDIQAYIIRSIPFSHPKHIKKILPFLRQQALFNALILSCIRTNLKKGNQESFSTADDTNEVNSKMIIFEVTPLSLQQITVTFEHPTEKTLVTADFDLSNISNLHCNLYVACEDSNISITGVEELAVRSLQMTYSIPITMRVLIKLWESRPIISEYDDSGLYVNDDVNMVDSTNDSMKINIKSESKNENINPFNCTSMEFENPDGFGNIVDGISNFNDQYQINFNSGSVYNHANKTNGLQDISGPIAPISSSIESFLDEVSEPSPLKPKIESRFAEIYRNKSVNEIFGAVRETLDINSAQKSGLEDVSKEALADATINSTSSTCPRFSTFCDVKSDMKLVHDDMNDNIEEVANFIKKTETQPPKNASGNTLQSSSLPDHVLPSVTLTPVVTLPSITSTNLGSVTSTPSSSTITSLSSGLNNTERCRAPDSLSSLHLPDSLTITPVSKKEVEERDKERKAKFEKEKPKKKRKIDSSSIGPPEKIRPKIENLKQTSLSVKQIDVAMISSNPSSNNSNMNKYPVPPTYNPNNNNNIVSPNLSNSPKMAVVSPKHSSISITKTNTSLSSLKNTTVTSPGKGSNDMKKTYKDSISRENKEKKSTNSNSSSRHSSPKQKSSNLKIRPTELTSITKIQSPPHDSNIPTNIDAKTGAPPLKNKLKEQNLASLIDKISKNHEDKTNTSSGKSLSPTLKDMKNVPPMVDATKIIGANQLSSQTKLPGEYTIKQSSMDGIRMTISNKSKKEQLAHMSKGSSSKNVPNLGNASPKNVLKSCSSSGSSIIKKSLSLGGKPSIARSCSPNSLTSKHSSSKIANNVLSKSKSTNHAIKSSDNSRKEKRQVKSHNNDKMITTSQPDVTEEDKSIKTQSAYQGFSKPLNTNFQIPKISDRNKPSIDVEIIKKGDFNNLEIDSNAKESSIRHEVLSATQMLACSEDSTKDIGDAITIVDCSKIPIPTVLDSRIKTISNNEPSNFIPTKESSSCQQPTNVLPITVESNDDNTNT